MHFKSSLRYFRMPCVLRRRLRNCSTQNSSEFLSFAFLFTDFRGIFGAHTFGKLAPFFFFFLFNYGEGLYFPRQPRDNLSKAILGVNFSSGFAFWEWIARQ